MPDHPGLGRRAFMHPQSHQWNIAPFMAANPATRWCQLPWPDAAFEVDQGDSGACTAASLLKIMGGKPCSHTVGTMLRRVKPNEPAESNLSRRLIMALYRRNVLADAWADNDAEADPSKAPKLEDLVSGSSVDAAMLTGRALGFWQTFRWCRSHDEADEWIRRGDGSPLQVGINWYAGFDDPDAEGIVRLTGEVRGGHALRVGWHDRRRGLWLLTNSWGRSWGKSGACWMPDEVFDRVVWQEDGECACGVEVVG